MCLPAVINAFVVARGVSRAFPYDTYSYPLRVVLMTIFLAAQAPELVSRDLRHRVLPLYFARPLRRPTTRWPSSPRFIAACLLMLDIPLLLLYVGTIVRAHGGAAVWAQTTALLPGLAVGLLWSVLLAAIGLALASLSGRRAFAAGVIAVFLFLTWIAVRRARASVGQRLRATQLRRRPAPLGPGRPVSPFTLLDGVRQWLGGTSPGVVPDPGGLGGPVYALCSCWPCSRAV